MSFPRKAIKALAAALAVLALPVAAEEPGQKQEQEAGAQLGLMGTIPIYWGEARQLGDFVDGSATPHWARAALERDFELRPLAWLDPAALEGLDYLLLAQPRALSGEENVALDAWVRAGGRLLLFADPMMTGHSAFGLGDRRRPQDVVLLSPILSHWGLALEFVVDQPAGPRVASEDGLALPVNLPGRFASRGDEENCVIWGEGVLAQCTIGEGTALVLADAALLDLHQPSPLAAPALEQLTAMAFAASGEIAGRCLSGAGSC